MKQLVLFANPADIYSGSHTDSPDAWDAWDINIECGDLTGDERYDTAAWAWDEKQCDIDAFEPRYELNDTPIPVVFNRQGRPMIVDGHHRTLVALERGTLLPVLFVNHASSMSISGHRDWHHYAV